MSWDIIVQDLPADIENLEDIPEDFEPQPLGKRSDLIARIRAVVPVADFADPSWGIIEGDDWSIEISMGDDEDCDGFAFHVRGGDAAVGVVAAILEDLRLRAIDAQSSEFFVAGPQALDSFREWRAFRDRVVGEPIDGPADL